MSSDQHINKYLTNVPDPEVAEEVLSEDAPSLKINMFNITVSSILMILWSWRRPQKTPKWNISQCVSGPGPVHLHPLHFFSSSTDGPIMSYIFGNLIYRPTR